VDELFGPTDDLVRRPPVLARLQVENIANLVTRSKDQVDVVLGVRGRETESDSGGDQGGGAAVR
jgi:hypothetical protein